MPVRARVLALSAVLVVAASAGAVPAMRPGPAAAAGPKVAIIVGPVGGLTSTYRSYGNEVASAATAAGATVVKAYSPNATWSNVRSAVNGANVIVYFGHGNGYPNPYGSVELTDRTNGWGLNRTTTNGDGDSWSSTLAYCGEKALLGTLTSSDGAVQRQYCAGGPITPAPNFTMVYAQAHYAPGFGERYNQSDPLTTLGEARARVRHYSTPILRLGGTFIATAYGDADEIVARVISQQSTAFGHIFQAGRGFSPSTLDITSHADVAGAQVWVQRTTISGFHFGEPDYWYAFAGNPAKTPNGGTAVVGPFWDISASAFQSDILWLYQSGISNGCATGAFCPRAAVTRGQMASFIARALDLPASATDWFADDAGSPYEADINRVAAAGITNGCAAGMYCPGQTVRRDQMASFLNRALGLPASPTNWFVDDDGNFHEPAINSVADDGVTNGCGGANYCPASTVTREQMAAFLHRALGG